MQKLVELEIEEIKAVVGSSITGARRRRWALLSARPFTGTVEIRRRHRSSIRFI